MTDRYSTHDFYGNLQEVLGAYRTIDDAVDNAGLFIKSEDMDTGAGDGK
jgi:hypothetical protein